MAYIRPKLVIFRIRGGGEPISDTACGIIGGAMVCFGMFTVGGEVWHIFGTDRSDPVVGVRFGVRI